MLHAFAVGVATFFSIHTLVLGTSAGDRAEAAMQANVFTEPAKQVALLTVFDNYPHNPDLQTAWGFACVVLIQDHVILFDTGGSGDRLLDNMRRAGISPSRIDAVVLSHIHGDHTGGLLGFLDANANVTVWIPRNFPDATRRKILQKGAGYMDVSGPVSICPSVSTTGELGAGIKEQALVVHTLEGLVVITGCAHPGIVELVETVRIQTGKEVYLVLGGFHLEGISDAEVMSIIDSLKHLGVKKAAPCHCSGQRTRELFERHYGDGYIANGVGKKIVVE
jgi:7,8-dihydropterin-6-yl-methyl-4-(beta-D-ribofuranosyl)aminobenzene 5'-phosphate synthase